MTNAERAKRFRTARTELNQHGTETQAQVYTATGVPASAISNLENPDSNRIPSSEKVNVLAEHYGINVAWLTGQSESPSLNENSRIATDTIGLSPKAVEKLTRMMADPKQKNAINSMIESEHFERMIQAIIVLADESLSDREDGVPNEIVDYGEAIRKHTSDTPIGFNLAEGDLHDYYSWKAERTMEALLRDVINMHYDKER